MVNKAFFLGAGFSIALAQQCITNNKKYPTLKNLSNEILNNFSKNSIYAHLNEISEKYKNNIEHLLTYLYSDLPWQNPQMLHLDKALYFELTNKIADYFNNIDINSEYDFQNSDVLAKYIIDNKITSITLNYDTLLEKLLFYYLFKEDSHGKFFNYFYKQAIIDIIERTPQGYTCLGDYFTIKVFQRKDNFPVIHKLHGSINWLWSGTNPADPIYMTHGNVDKYLRKDLTSYIIPPVLDKTNFYNHNILKSIWADAYDVLKNADEIYIIGFSFPVTDLSIRFLFDSALSNKEKQVNIYVINTDERIKNRYKEIFGNNVDFTYCCENALNEFINRYIE